LNIFACIPISRLPLSSELRQFAFLKTDVPCKNPKVSNIIKFLLRLTRSKGESMEEWLLSPMGWFILGSALVALELLLPGLVSVFLGLGAILTALALRVGWVASPQGALISFIVFSTLLLLFVRAWVGRLLPATRIESETDETKLALYQRVEVVESIPSGGEGRISFRGTTWKARFASGSQDAAQLGNRVTILGQDNITFIVGLEETDQNGKSNQPTGGDHSK